MARDQKSEVRSQEVRKIRSLEDGKSIDRNSEIRDQRSEVIKSFVVIGHSSFGSTSEVRKLGNWEEQKSEVQRPDHSVIQKLCVRFLTQLQ